MNSIRVKYFYHLEPLTLIDDEFADMMTAFKGRLGVQVSIIMRGLILDKRIV